MSQEKIDLLCHECGKTFSSFLLEMAEQNAKVLCPACRANSGCSPTQAAKPSLTN
jgi:hypothetical protein